MQDTPAIERPLAPEQLTFRRVLVPMDGSALAESALAPARELADVFGAELELLAVDSEPAGAAAQARDLQVLADGSGASTTFRVDGDVAGAILRHAADRAGTLLCMASHGRSGLPRAILGSVARAVVAGAGAPVVLVGPHYDIRRPLDGGPVLACVDGSAPSEAIIPLAASWAGALGVTLGIVTVAEPLTRPLDQRPYHRLFGPDTDAGEYVTALARQWRPRCPDVVPLALYDPLGPADGLRVHLRTQKAGLLAVTTRPRVGAANLFGSRAAAIVRTSPVPVLVVAQGNQA